MNHRSFEMMSYHEEGPGLLSVLRSNFGYRNEYINTLSLKVSHVDKKNWRTLATNYTVYLKLLLAI